MENCPFCPMFTEDSPDVLRITPLNPITEGHLLFIPREHVKDFAENPQVSARTMSALSEYAKNLEGGFNAIASRGEWATQSVFHLHMHLVPRRKGDGLKLPWTNQKPLPI